MSVEVAATITVRDATSHDAPACAAIYRYYVAGTAITFELDAPPDAVMASRIASSQERHAWLVAQRDGEVVGYAYGTTWRDRAAYRFSCETTVYLRHDVRREGAGQALMTELLARLTTLGYRRAIAAVTLPNEASVGLHEAVGFTPVGRFLRVGWKLGSWHDVGWWQRDLENHATDPAA